MELQKTRGDASFSNEEIVEESGSGPNDLRNVPQFVMGTNKTSSDRSSENRDQVKNGDRKDSSNSSRKESQNISHKKEKKLANNTENCAKNDVSLMSLIADVNVGYTGLEKLSGSNSHIDLTWVNKLILSMVSSLSVSGQLDSQLVECSLVSQENIPEVFFGTNMKLEQKGNMLSIGFDNFNSSEQVISAYKLVSENPVQLSSLIDALNKKSFFLKELKIGNQVVELPRREEIATPFNMIAASFKYPDHQDDNNEREQSSSQQEEDIENIIEVDNK